MSKTVIKEVATKWERIYEDSETIDTWRYDAKISRINPYQIDIKYKKPIKELKNKS